MEHRRKFLIPPSYTLSSHLPPISAVAHVLLPPSQRLFLRTPPPPSSLQPAADQLPCLRVVIQDGDDDLEGELEEDPPEANLEIELYIDPESDSNSVSPSSYFS